MGFDLGHTIISLSKLALRTKRKMDKNNAHKKIKVYRLGMDHTYRTYEPTPKSAYKSYMFEGIPVEKRDFDMISPSEYVEEVNKPMGDVFSVEVSSFILNEKSYKILYPYIKNEVQILKIKSHNEHFYVVNVTNIVDCLDYDKSKLKLFPSSQRIMRVEKYAFKEQLLSNVIIFKLPEFLNTLSYVTEDFKRVVEDNNIKGFKFEEL